MEIHLMRRNRMVVPLFVLGLAWASLAPGQVKRVEELRFPPLPDFPIPEPQRVVLDNGMVVLLLEDHELPLVNAVALIQTGSRLEPADKIGLAELTGAVLRTGGTERMSANELDEYLEGRAAVIEASIGTSSGRATMSCLREDFPEVLQVFADVLRRPAFDEERFKVAVNQTVAEISRQNDSPQQILFREFQEIIYGPDSPYARTETYATVGNIRREDLIDWHRRHFHPNRILLGLVGDFDSRQALKLIREVFGDWPSGSPAEKPEVPYRTESSPGIYYIEKSDMTQAAIAMGHLGIRKDNPDLFAVEVMNQVLSGSFASRLFSNIRSRKGLAYAVSGSVGSGWDHPGVFRMFMTTKTETTAAGIDALLEEARNMTAQPPTDEEVEKAKASILNSFIFTSDSTRKILEQQLTFAYYGYPLDWLSRYRQGIEAVTTEEVRRVAAKYLRPQEFATLVVGPSQGMDRPLSDFGPVTAVDITIPEPEAPRVEGTPEAAARGAALVEQAVGALGGPERVDAVASLFLQATLVQKLPDGGEMEIPTKTWLAFPDRLRREITLPFGTLTTVAGPEGGFALTPQGVQDLPESQRHDLLQSMRRNLLALLQGRRDPTFRAVALGVEEVAGGSAELVQVEFRGETTILAIDPESGRVLQIRYRGSGPQGAPGEVAQTFSDYREVEGLAFPFAISGTFDGEESFSVRVDTLELNTAADPEIFARPEGPS